jgi:pyruvate/2-oxoglutarate dehydrogenase complex dihydrolipoamide acyltransferase (E2) component
MFSSKVKVGALAVVIAGAGAGATFAGAQDDERATGPEADRAATAAVAHVGGGQVTGLERESEGEVVWEVEVRRDATTHEVELNRSYDVVSSKAETGDSEDGPEERDDEGVELP